MRWKMAGAVAVVALGGCGASAHVSIGNPTTTALSDGPASVSKTDLQNSIAQTLAKDYNKPAPIVQCPGDLKGTIGTVMYCQLPNTGTQSYPVKVTVFAVQGTDVQYHISVSTTPGTYTEKQG